MPRGKSRPVTIGELEFKTTGKAIKYAQEVITKYPRGGVLNPVDASFFFDVLALHPRSQQKIGSKVKQFEIRKNPIYPNMSVYLVREDRTSTEFSWRKCIEGEAKGELQKEALREAVAYQIIAFRDQQLMSGQALFCPVTRERITFENYHVDHVTPSTFDQLVADWLRSEGIALEDVRITPSLDNEYGRKMTAPEQIASWTQFHTSRAVLRMMTKEGNLRLPKYKVQKSDV